MIKLSVICSNYNSLQYISDYINILNSQLLQEFEIVVVDANSTDGSLDIIKNSIFRHGIAIKIIEQKQRISVYEAWNLAIQKAQGQYVVNYNTDDFLFANALLTYERYTNKYPDTDLIYSPYFIHQNYNPLEIINVRIFLNHSHSALKTFCYCGPFPCVRKKAIEDVGYFNTKYKSSADYDMWLKLSYYKRQFLSIPEVLGSFYFRQSSVSNTNMVQNQQEDKEIQNNY